MRLPDVMKSPASVETEYAFGRLLGFRQTTYSLYVIKVLMMIRSRL